MVVRPEEDPVPMEKRTKKRRSLGAGGDGGGGASSAGAGDSTSNNDTMVLPSSLKKKQRRMSMEKMKDGEVTLVGGSCSQGALLVGMSAAEITMIRRLAGNDTEMRKKTMRKLRKWLNVLVLRCPDDPDIDDVRKDIEPNVVRVWKALFYCMWMADKPLPQEQLADQISALAATVGFKPVCFLVFVEWFFRTMAREWNWIDRFRLDKFMMLFRRFLRQILKTMSTRKWSPDLVDGFLKIVRTYIFNRQADTSPKLKKGQSGTDEFVVKCPMGLQHHFVDIFLEELAKSGGDQLKPQKVMHFLGPFIEEMATNDDDRVLSNITERIFHHLMKQSDVGIEYQENLMGLEDMEEDEEVDDDDDDENGNDEKDDEVFEAEDDGPLDPRAGAVDVFLPQLQLDYGVLADKLSAAAESVRKHNRKKLRFLAASFRDLVQGKYPLALPEEEPYKAPIPRHEVEKAAQRLLEFEDADGETKIRKTKKQRRRDAKRLQQHEQLEVFNDTVGSEDGSDYLNDTELMTRIDENYEKYVDQQMRKKRKSVKTEDTEVEVKKKKRKSVEKADEMCEDEITDSAKKAKKKKKKSVSPSPGGESETDKSFVLFEEDGEEEHSKVKKKKKKYITQIEFEGDEDEVDCCSTPTEIIINRKKKRLSSANDTFTCTMNDSLHTPKNSKQRRSPTSKSKLNSTSLSERRRINFVLHKNLEHEATDYNPRISQSPAIPYDGRKTPTTGILKAVGSRHSTPVAAKTIGSKTSPRKRALDFF